MELAGNEKKIQTLFRELKLADERVAPEFIRLWNRAQAFSPGRSRGFKISLAVATALFVITLSSLVHWSRNWRGSQPSILVVASGPATIDSIPVPPATQPATPPTTLAPIHPAVAAPLNRVRSNRRDRRVVAPRHPDLNAINADIREADSISSWQSPTAMLLQSPADDVLTSLPQLDRSLTEFKRFLPNRRSEGEDNE